MCKRALLHNSRLGEQDWDGEVPLILPGEAMAQGSEFMLHITMEEHEVRVWIGGTNFFASAAIAHLGRRYYSHIDHVQVDGELELYEALRIQPV